MAFDINSIPGYDAQSLHVFFAATCVLALADHVSLPVSFLVTLAVCFVKEAMESLGIAPWEPKQPWANSMIDFAFLAGGAGTAFILKLI